MAKTACQDPAKLKNVFLENRRKCSSVINDDICSSFYLFLFYITCGREDKHDFIFFKSSSSFVIIQEVSPALQLRLEKLEKFPLFWGVFN